MKKSLLILAINTMVLSPFYSQTLSDSLVAHYLLNGNGNDNIGSSHGTVIGATTTVDRNSNTNAALYFDGIDDWVDIGNSPELAIYGDITVSAWVKTPSSWPTVYKDYQIYTRNTEYVSTIYGVNLFLNDPHLSSRNFGFILKTGTNSWGNDYAQSSSSLQLNTWYFVVGVREGNLVKIYVNGILEGTDLGSSSSINYGPTPMAAIGQKDGLSATFMKGTIDDVRIYKRALTASDIQTLYNFVGLEENNNLESHISIYPNPASDYISISSTKNTSSIGTIEVYAINGQKVKTYSKNQLDNLSKIDIADLADGSYFLKIFDIDNTHQSIKFIKTKN